MGWIPVADPVGSGFGMAAPGSYWEGGRGPFVLFFAAGAVFILSLKAFGAPQWLVTAIPCVLMLVYTGTLWDSERNGPKYESAGDNLYYLGFLYTLTSMAHSLYRFSTDENIEAIVTNFGIAISTTILGMALRILVGQQAEEAPETVDEEVRMHLAEAARRLRGEIEFTVDEFRGFREKTREALDEGLAEVRERLGEASDTAGKIGEGLSEIEERTRAQAEKAAEQWKKIGHHADGVSESLVAMAGRIADFDFPRAFVERATQLAADSMKDAVEERVAEIRRGTEELRSGVEEFRRAVEALTKDFAAVALPRVVSEAVAPATEDLRAAGAELTASAGGLTDSATAIRSALEGGRDLSAATDELRSGLDRVAGALGAVSERVSEVGGASGQSLSRSVERIEAANRGLEDALKRVSPLVRDLMTELAKRERGRPRFSLFAWLFRRRGDRPGA